MKIKLERMSNPSKEKIINDILRVDKIVNKQILTVKDYQIHSQVSHGTLRKYLGSWHEALCAAGLKHKSNCRIKTHKLTKQAGKYLTDNEIIEELKRVAQKLKQTSLTTTEVDKHSRIISASTVSNRIGWKKGLTLAGLDISSQGKRYTKDECFENLLNVWTHYGRQPKQNEMKNYPSIVGAKAYILRWKTWLKALEAFIEEVNKEEELPKSQAQKEKLKTTTSRQVKQIDKRDIPYRLRYRVLSRDNFKCSICGNSPATDSTCKLHVDHIYPFSKGGKTTLENLRTLCAKCNLGKGDIIESTNRQR